MSQNGARADYDESEVEMLSDLIARYEKAAMPFTALEFPRSSRYRLVDQLRLRIATDKSTEEDSSASQESLPLS
ncbi:MAG: hypothetical protein HY253_05290 [Burkholderiales bacterium]|nr:hypothetical protein [Burkholderiales bacterium]